MVDRGANGMRNLGGVIGTPALKEACVAPRLSGMSLLVNAALEISDAQERTCIIFGALASKQIFPASVLPLMEFPGLAGAWDTGLRFAVQRAIPAFVLTERA